MRSAKEDAGFVYVYRACLILTFPIFIFMIASLAFMNTRHTFGEYFKEYWGEIEL